MDKSFAIDLLPFYWRLSNKNDRTKNLVSSNFLFEFDIDTRHNLLIQKRNDEVLNALNIIYQEEYNIGYLQDQNVIAKQYGTDFFDFLKKHAFVHKRIKTVLEIGCGGCVMLSKLQSIGYEVTGIDSSPFAFNEGQKKGIHVIQDFFPSKSLSDKFDLIFHVDVLEHVDDYVGFLKSQHDQLTDDGFLVVNVPDASESIKLGDFSLAMHQHLNYFSTDSLTSVLESSGFEVLAAERAGYGGSIYALAAKKSKKSDNSSPIDNGGKHFLVAAAQSSDKFSRAIHKILASRGNTLGFYVPLRALPYVTKTKINCDFRFFDDTPHWHHLFFDGMDVKIENFDDLVRDPVTHVVIMSFTFADVIKKKIQRQFGDSINVLTLNDIINNSF
jgi:2-polyprenyl-3-methyl-5-hydroxy-6-metoxy-1,4-benzoquinol methylase